MGDFNLNNVRESKKLALHIKENEARFLSGELDLNATLDKTDQLYKVAAADNTAVGAMQDSTLLQLQSKIVKDCARSYQVDSLVFDPRVFCDKLKTTLCPNVFNGNDTSASRQNAMSKVWEKLGEASKNTMNTVPTFSFIYGTFDADPVVIEKKERKLKDIDKIGPSTKPEVIDNSAMVQEQDIMLKNVIRVFTIFSKLIEKSEKKALCFYEFVTDPNSFTRTVENMFLVSFLVKDGNISLFPDEQGLPCLRLVQSSEKPSWGSESMQSVLTISMEDWENIVKTFKFKKPLIPPRQTPTAADVE